MEFNEFEINEVYNSLASQHDKESKQDYHFVENFTVIQYPDYASGPLGSLSFFILIPCSTYFP